jgi:hypothetical protein
MLVHKCIEQLLKRLAKGIAIKVKVNQRADLGYAEAIKE